jgi:hypothetical protein
MSTHVNPSSDKKNGTTPPPPPGAKTDAKHEASAKPHDSAANPGTAAPDTKVHGSLAPTNAAAATTTAGDGAPAGETEEEKAKRVARKIYIVVGTVQEFKNAAEAEKFLNSGANVPADYSVIQGNKIERKTKVALR